MSTIRRSWTLALALSAAVLVALGAFALLSSQPDSPTRVSSATFLVSSDPASYAVFAKDNAKTAADTETIEGAGDRHALRTAGTGELESFAPVVYPDGSKGYVAAYTESFCVFRRLEKPVDPRAGDIAGAGCLLRESDRGTGAGLLSRADGSKTQTAYLLVPDGVTSLIVREGGDERREPVRGNVAKLQVPANPQAVAVVAATDRGEQDLHLFGR